ncbi:5 nucleotidase deoxy cytosolic type C [Bifidobacterium saguini DSM 23967]|uniref:5 nucleotidase deoxy cytosolic type C n=1 Tax=Bifidobacterium saguini DSM 23967 TaxID=1437607 RepID=A0A087DCT7_9BIFI|nr:5'-nucleotidase [Bifidobacterium saguini]KFI93337.1 5 nucleotidase deoxy cytosolic type C [Bifidobacterium saguini DSM 23967]
MIPEQYRNQQVGVTGYRVLNLDLDGVCADYSGALRDYLVDHGVMNPDAHPEENNYALYENAGWPFRTREEYLAAHKAAEQEHLYATMRPIEGAPEALRFLAENHVYIRIVTHRLFVSGQHQMAVSDTAQWLDTWGIPYMSLCFTGLKDSMQATVHIDDSPSNITALRKVGQHVVVFDQPYNQNFVGPRIHDWSRSATQQLLDWFEQWPETGEGEQ